LFVRIIFKGVGFVIFFRTANAAPVFRKGLSK
jgi:hypothetical protein